MTFTLENTASDAGANTIRALWQERLAKDAADIFVAFARLTRGDDGHKPRLEFDRYSYAQVDRIVGRAAEEYSKKMPARKAGEPVLTVALLAETSLECLVAELALARL